MRSSEQTKLFPSSLIIMFEYVVRLCQQNKHRISHYYHHQYLARIFSSNIKMGLSLQQHPMVIYYPFRIEKDIFNLCPTRVWYVPKMDFQTTFSKALSHTFLFLWKNKISENTASLLLTRRSDLQMLQDISARIFLSAYVSAYS